jgi:hypothetical protein
MQQFIANYLFKNGNCSIAGLGNISLHTQPANYSFGEQIIESPKYGVDFTSVEANSHAFTTQFAQNNNLDLSTAERLIADFAASVLKGESKNIAGIGTFEKNNLGDIDFNTQQLHAAFLPNIKAERIAHKNQVHNMLVGETETNTAVMADYFAEEDDKKRKIKKWQWFVIAATLISIAGIAIFYFSNSSVANLQKLPHNSSEKTYRLLQAK